MSRVARVLASLLVAGAILVPISASASEITRSVVGNVSVITISGQAMPGDAAKFAEIVASTPPDPNTIVDLSGPGGMVYDGMRIGELIHKLGWATRVGDGHACFSTCAFIWLAGKHRILSSEGHLAFHAPYDGRTNQVTDVGRRMMAIYARVLGLNEATVAFVMTKKPGEGFTWLDEKQAKTLDLAMDVQLATHRSVGRFSTAAIDQVEGAAARVREGGLDALYKDIADCYAGYRRLRSNEKGFQCFVLESAGIAMAGKRAKAEGQRLDRRFATPAVVRRLVAALSATGHTRMAAKKLVQRWENDLHATAQR